MMGNNCKCGLGPISLGFGFGVANAIYTLVVAWAGWLGGYGTSIIDLWSSIYPGYSATFLGGLAGGVWGYVYGFIFGLLAAVFYNLCLRCCPKSTSCGDNGSCGK